MRSLKRCIHYMHSFAHNSDKIPLEVVPAPTMFAKDLFMRLKRKKLGATIDLRQGRKEQVVARVREAEEGEKDTPHPLTRKGKKAVAPRKRKHAALSSSFAPK